MDRARLSESQEGGELTSLSKSVHAQVPLVTLLLMCAGHDQVRAYIKQLKETMDFDAMQQQQ